MSPDENPNYEEWTVRGGEDSQQTYVGVTSGGVPVFHEQPDDVLFGASPDEESREVLPERERGPSMQAGESLGETIERVGEELGWESLSEFAREHLESGTETGSESGES